MADESAFGGQPETAFGSGFYSLGGEPAGGPGVGADVPPAASPPVSASLAAPTPAREGFGSGMAKMLGAPQYRAPDPELSPLDQTADTLQQRIKRANDIAANPMLQFFSPDGVQRARDFVPKATEELQKIRQQQATIKAGRLEGEQLGLAPGEVPDEASRADRVEAAVRRALKGDMRAFQGLQAVDSKRAEAIQDQVQEVVAGHLTKAQFAFDSLAGMQNEGQYVAKLAQLRKEGALTDLEALGMKVPPSFEAFQSSKALEGKALREARVGIDTIRGKLEERNTYQPMETKEAETYKGRLTTVYGDQLSNGTWGRNASSNVRGFIVNGAADPRDLQKNFVLATPDQRKEISEAAKVAVPKEDLEKHRGFNRTYELATKDAKGNAVPPDKINTNPNVQQAIAESLAANLRGGMGGANVGLLNIETGKRGYVQGLLDKIKSGYAGGMNAISGDDVRSYMTNLTQKQIRDVLDVLKAYNDQAVSARIGNLAERAGALGLDRTVFGLDKTEAKGAIDDAIERGRQAQIARMLPNHQAIGGGDGVIQLVAQRPGAGAVAAPPGTAPTTQLPGGQPLATPVQQATQPQQPAAPQPPAPQPTPQAPSAASGGAGAPPAAPQPPAPQPTPQAPSAASGGAGAPPAAAPGTPGPPTAGGGSAPPSPITIAGQQVTVPLPPGASPAFVAATQRIESGKSKNPWTAEVTAKGPDGKPLSSASGAYQFTDGTWNENKPAGAPARAKDATPEQQSQAFATLTAKNGAALQAAGVPVNDTSLYVAHNLGATGGTKLLTADPKADAREVVGERAARNNPLFFRGRPTVEKVLERYNAEMEKGLQTTPEGGAKSTETSGGGILSRVRQTLDKYFMAGVAGGEAEKRKASQAVIDAGVEHAPAIGSTLGAAVGTAGGPVGTVAGGAAGGSAGQALKDYIQGRDFSGKDVAKEGALGAVLGITSAARPVAAAAARTVGAGAVEAGNAAIEGKNAADVVDAGLKGSGLAAGGEMFGRALGMVGHKVWNMFAPESKTAVREAAAKYATAEEALAKEAPTLPSVNGVGGGKNPKYEAAEKARTEAETVLKDAGLKPEEAAYAHRVSSEGVPKQEAEAARPGKLEEERLGKGYQRLEQAVAEHGIGAPKAMPKLTDGPLAAVESKAVSQTHKELAERTEMAITAPAANWQEKWVQLKDARSALLTAERDALASTAPGKTKIAEDMRTLADTVRVQQEKAAKYVFGDRDGEKFMSMLKVLDTRYRNLMKVTNGGDLVGAAAMKGEAGREAERKFVAFAHDDPQAIAAYRAMRGAKGDVAEATVPWTVAAEGLPVVGKVVKVAKLASIMRDWARERAAGSPVRFSDMANTELGAAAANQGARDVLGSAGARGAAM